MCDYNENSGSIKQIKHMSPPNKKILDAGFENLMNNDHKTS